jgi:pyruvate formate lyase activating enzyme
MIIKGLQEFTLIDYPKKVACTIFTFGCNFRCKYCHNPELVFNNGTPEIPEEEILKFLDERKDFLDGICITGGEPTLHKDLPEFIFKIKKFGLLVKLDTNGTNPEMLKKLTKNKLVDYVAMDIKAPLEKYEKVVGVKVNKKKIQESVNVIRNSGLEYEFRSTILPALHSKEDLIKIGEWLKGSKKFCIQNFVPTKTLEEKFKKEKSFSSKELGEFVDILKPYFEKVEIRE